MQDTSPLFRAGGGDPLVLLHGFTATWRIWRPVLPGLVDHFDVLAPTMHGHDGGPAMPFGRVARTPGDAADLVELQLDEAGIEQCHVVGSSMGGAIALELAKRGRALSVVGIAPGGGWRAHSGEAERLVRSFTRTRKRCGRVLPHVDRLVARPAARRFVLRDLMRHGERVSPQDAAGLLRSSMACDVVDEVFASIRSGEALVGDLDRITCPVLLAWPEHDVVLPMHLHAPRLLEEIPEVELQVLPGCGHVPTWDAPGLVAETITAFATRTRVADPAG